MSSSSSMTLRCPKCGKETDVRVWNSINVTFSPEMKQKIKDGTAFNYRCPECGFSAPLDHSFLYHDMEQKLMIYYVTDDQQMDEVKAFFDKDFKSYAGSENDPNAGYTLRIATSFERMQEKLHIFDAGYDDRIIELGKVFYYVQLVEKDPDFESELLFVRDGRGKEYFQIVGGKDAGYAIDLPENFYDIFKSSLASKVADVDEYVIDQQWAVDFLNDNTSK